jgi:hypothetical protein
VVLLHPRVIAPRAEVLRAFIRHVEASGGTFMTVDHYSDSLIRSNPADRLIVRVDLGQGVADIGQMARDLSKLGATDAIVSGLRCNGESFLEIMAGDTTIFDAVTAALKAEGIRVHASVPPMSMAAQGRSRPDLAMVGSTGAASEVWLSPSQPEVRQAAADLAVRLVREHDIDGLTSTRSAIRTGTLTSHRWPWNGSRRRPASPKPIRRRS